MWANVEKFCKSMPWWFFPGLCVLIFFGMLIT